MCRTVLKILLGTELYAYVMRALTLSVLHAGNVKQIAATTLLRRAVFVLMDFSEKKETVQRAILLARHAEDQVQANARLARTDLCRMEYANHCVKRVSL